MTNNTKKDIIIGSDHGGMELKSFVISLLKGMGIDVTDIGTFDSTSVDYPDYAEKVSQSVSSGESRRGILICGSGIGMSIIANKYPRVRAALCYSQYTAKMSREHNDSNLLVIGERTTPKDVAEEILKTWLNTNFEGGRHQKRLDKISKIENSIISNKCCGKLSKVDIEVFDAIKKETKRQSNTLELIASENFVSEAVLEAQGSIMTNKYAEGYPGKRYYGGCENVDIVERLAIERTKKLFKADHANVQPHSGSQANMAVYFSILKPGDTMMGMNLSHGGHLSHGHPINFTGRFYKVIPYGVRRDTDVIDYEEMHRLAIEHKPRLIVVGASAYPRQIDYKKFKEAAEEVGAKVMADIAHIAGLIIAGLHPNPFDFGIDFVTTTTHKTLRGPRGGIIMCKEEYAKEIDKNIFPGIQGGPLMHVIAAKAVALKEALSDEFKEYQRQVVKNAAVISSVLKERGFRIVSGGTDNHLLLVDLRGKDNTLTGKDAEAALEEAGFTVNKNTVPYDDKSPFVTSGIRIGSPAVTTRGMKEAEMTKIANLIADVLDDIKNEAVIAKTRKEVNALCEIFPLYQHRL